MSKWHPCTVRSSFVQFSSRSNAIPIQQFREAETQQKFYTVKNVIPNQHPQDMNQFLVKAFYNL